MAAKAYRKHLKSSDDLVTSVRVGHPIIRFAAGIR